MAALSQAQEERVQEALKMRYGQLIREIREEMENAGDQQYIELIGRVPHDIGDESVGDALADLSVARIDRQIQEIRDIEGAHRRLKEGSFGVCIDCGEDIGFDRLMAYPTAKRCIRCQQKREKTFAHEGNPTL